MLIIEGTILCIFIINSFYLYYNFLQIKIMVYNLTHEKQMNNLLEYLSNSAFTEIGLLPIPIKLIIKSNEKLNKLCSIRNKLIILYWFLVTLLVFVGIAIYKV